jgi:hypothetical protein
LWVLFFSIWEVFRRNIWCQEVLWIFGNPLTRQEMCARMKRTTVCP